MMVFKQEKSKKELIGYQISVLFQSPSQNSDKKTRRSYNFVEAELTSVSCFSDSYLIVPSTRCLLISCHINKVIYSFIHSCIHSFNTVLHEAIFIVTNRSNNLTSFFFNYFTVFLN